MNLASHLIRVAQVHPDRPALAIGNRIVATWAEMAERVARLAGALTGRLGLGPGDRVALVLKNSPVYVELMYACWHAGLVALPINASLHPRELSFILDHSGARLAFVTPDHIESVVKSCSYTVSDVRIIDVASSEFHGLFDAHAIAMFPVTPDEVAWLFYTSGTTGRPKGAMLTHRNLLAMALSYFVDIDPPSPGGCIIHTAPMSHGSGLYIVPHVMQANCQVIPESGGFHPDEFFQLLRNWSGVSMFAVPTMIKRLVNHNSLLTTELTNLRVIVFGGAPMNLADLRAAIARFGFKFAQLYGQGESPMTITGMTRATIEEAYRAGDTARLASVGIPQTVVNVRVADERDCSLPAGESGEILVRGDTVMKGYWRDEKASAETLRGGWLHTGDIGYFDASGCLTLKDRSKDLIISGGSNVYPREVEVVLLRHGAVSDVSVIGVADPEWGESVLAFVVTRTGVAVTIEELDRWCLDNLARFKRPKHYRFVDQLPRNNYGKILKTELRTWVKTG